MSERIRLADLDEQTKGAVADTRRRVAALHAELPRWGLVVWTAGNVSERVVVDRGDGPVKTDLFVIKPSGVSYDELTADTMVICTLDGEKIDDGTPASLTPSSDTAAHAYVYRHRDDVGGVVHTHSPYATAWAARREPIPFALIGDDSIGRGIVETLEGSRSPAVLMANHGPFTVGKDAHDAVKAAVMCEEVARTMSIAEQLGDVKPIPADMVDRLNDRYQHVYGQH